MPFFAMTMLCITTIWIDFEHRLIPDATTYPAMLFGIAASAAFPSIWGVENHFLAAGFALGSGAIAGGLLALVENLTDKLQAPEPYKLYFIAATILLLPGLCVLSSMIPLPVEKRMIKKTWFDFLW